MGNLEITTERLAAILAQHAAGPVDCGNAAPLQEPAARSGSRARCGRATRSRATVLAHALQTRRGFQQRVQRLPEWNAELEKMYQRC